MSEERKRAVGYCRVSGDEQAAEDKTSLEAQRREVAAYCARQGWELAEVYEDAGFSGGSIEGRPAFLRMLADARAGRFARVVVAKIDRFGRNLRDFENAVHELESNGVTVHSVGEDFGQDRNGFSRGLRSVVATFAQMERDRIRERTVAGRKARAAKGYPISGKYPFARTFDRQAGRWALDERKARLVRETAERFLAGESIKDLAHELRTKRGLPLGPHYLITVLRDRSGDSWSERIDGDTFTYTIPRLLDEDTIRAVTARLKHNRIDNRAGEGRHVLTGFVRCARCGKSLPGQTQTNRAGKQYRYHQHPGGRYERCKAFSAVPAPLIENAVFRTIFENVGDETGFREAIARSLPDAERVAEFQGKVRAGEAEVGRLRGELERLVDLALSGALQRETIAAREARTLAAIKDAEAALERDRWALEALPDMETAQRQAKRIRYALSDWFGSEDRLEEMGYAEKKALLHHLFDGKDEEGRPLGVYVEKKAPGVWEYEIRATLFEGARFLKDSDIDFDYEDEPVSGGRKRGGGTGGRGTPNQGGNPGGTDPEAGGSSYSSCSPGRADHPDLHPRAPARRPRRPEPPRRPGR